MYDKLSGILPAFLSPLDQHRKFAPAIAEKLLAYLLEAGVDGIYVAGSTGEGPLLTADVRKEIVETLAPLMPAGKRLIVHVGAQDLRMAIDLAQHAAQFGACAISSLPPGGDWMAVREYYRGLAQESPVPLVLYYFPVAVPGAFRNPEDLIEMCELPNVVGVKFTDYNLFLLHRLIKLGKTVFNGYDEVLAGGLLMGAQGGIGSTYNVMPKVYLKIAEAARAGDWEAARRWQFAANRVIEVLIQFPFMAALRTVMADRGFDCGPSLKVELLGPAERRKLLTALDLAMTSELKSIIE